MPSIEKIKTGLRKKSSTEQITDDMYLSSGSTLLNLACTKKPFGAFLRGHYYLFIGDSDSGKTFFCLTCLAEATINKNFDNYRLIYDAPEHGAIMDFEKFFGSEVARRVESPSREKDGTPHHSETVQEFYYHVSDAIEDGHPFIYVLDSQDSLSSREEISKFVEHKKAFRKPRREGVVEKKPAGSYGDGKAKTHSNDLRQLMAPLSRTGSILIIINQTRDSFDMFEKSTYSGGRALKFYATLQLWSSPAGKIKRAYKGKDRQLGVNCKIRVKKNRITGQDREIMVPIYHSVGIDEIGSLIDYLVAEGVWDCTDKKITVTGLGPEFTLKREQLVAKIEAEGMEEDVRELVVQTWEDIENAITVKRKSRYEQ